MRIKKISNDKIVVQLTDTDLEYFDLDIDKTAPQSADLHKFLFEVMELVKTETGFDPYNGGQVIVEAAMSQSGMSLIISKIRSDKNSMSREDFGRVKGVSVKKSSSESVLPEDIAGLIERAGIRRTKTKRCTAHNSVFEFESFADFEKAVCVSDSDFRKSTLYRNKSRYALVYSDEVDIREYNILSEYALHIKRNDVYADSIRERWHEVAACDALSEMAHNLRKMNYL